MTGTVYTIIGLGFLLAALLPRLLRQRPISLPLAFLALGLLLFHLPLDLPVPDVMTHRWFLERLSELTIILSLAGVGLRIDRPFRWRTWGTTWRLLGIAMPLTIAAMTLLGVWASLPVATAILLAAALAPTDPVLAGEIQLGEPNTDDPDDETRFGLTSEAGLNDALAMPFVWLAVMLASAVDRPDTWLAHWFAVDVVWKIAIGLAVGFVMGRVLSWLSFRISSRNLRLAEASEGSTVLAGTFLVYGITDLAHGYGYLAVFVAAVVHRNTEPTHDYHRELVTFGEQVERLLIVVVLLVVGGAISAGALQGITWRDVVLVAALLLVVRPLAGWLSLLGGRGTPRERRAIAVFGVRGVASINYLALAAASRASRIWIAPGQSCS